MYQNGPAGAVDNDAHYRQTDRAKTIKIRLKAKHNRHLPVFDLL